MKPIIAASSWLRDGYLSEEHSSVIRMTAPNYELCVGPFDKLSADEIERVEILFGNASADTLKNYPNLRYFQTISAGADNYADRNLYARDGIILANGSGVYGQPISEHLLAMALSFTRGMHSFRNNEAGEWVSFRCERDFADSTVAVIGLGDIGGMFARKCALLGARVLAVKRTATDKPDYVDELYPMDGIDSVIPKADFIALCLPNTPETQRILSRDRIALMKPSAVVLNIGRGAAIDQQALIEALECGRIGGAGLDVTDPEPLPKDNPLWRMKNVLITCHTSGYSKVNEDRIFTIFIDNLKRYITGEPMRNIVDFELKY